MQVRANSLTMRYTLDGSAGAPVVTLSHSLATGFGMWAAQQLAALTSYFHVLRYDTRGHGGTACGRAACCVRDHEDTLGRVIDGHDRETLARTCPDLLAGFALCDPSSRIPPKHVRSGTTASPPRNQRVWSHW